MPNISIDTEVLNALAQSLSQAANLLNNAITGGPFKQTGVEPSGTVERKKRGRPSKQLLKDLNTLLPANNTEIITVEDPDPILKEVYTPKKDNNYIFASKRLVDTGSEHSQSSCEVKKKPGDIKFIDISNVGDRIPSEKYPDPSQPRPAAKLMSFICSKCNASFECYPSELPQAFVKEKSPDGFIDKPRIYCNNCNVMAR